MGSSGGAELFFVVVVADSIGSAAVLKRIQEQFDGREGTLQAGLTLSTTHRSVAAVKRNANESADIYLEKVSSEIQAMMNQEIASRVAANGQ
jgi:hypothetical protein